MAAKKRKPGKQPLARDEPLWTKEAIEGAAQSLCFVAQVPAGLIDAAASEILRGSEVGRKVIERASRAALGRQSETRVLEYDLRILTDAKILMEGRSS